MPRDGKGPIRSGATKPTENRGVSSLVGPEKGKSAFECEHGQASESATRRKHHNTLISGLDELQERFAAWQINSPNGDLPDHFDEGFVLSQTGTPFQAQILVRDAADHLDAFRRCHGAHVETSPLNLERIFPLLLEETPSMEPAP